MNDEKVDNLGEDICNVFGDAFGNKDVAWWGDTNQLRAYLDSKKQVYYLVEKEGDAWKLEFWIDSYATDRLALQDELHNVVDSNARNFCFLSYYNARGCSGRLQIRGAKDLAADITSMREMLMEIEGRVKGALISKEDEKSSVVGLETLTIADALKRNFKVPEYQRGYCWEAANVVGLLEDVKTWMATHRKDTQYRIGTVVLKKTTDKTNDVYEIVDGQQRLTTLFLYDAVSRKGQENSGGTSGRGKFVLGQNNAKKTAVKRLKAAAESIEKWRSNNVAEDGKKDPIDFSRISIAAVIIPDGSDDLAFEFFNHLNSSGKPLSDYDLLKSHHLRYIEGDALSEKMSDRWNKLDHVVSLGKLEGGNNGSECDGSSKFVTKGDLLHETLYRIRMWLRKQDFVYYADELPSHELFREFSMDYVPIKGLCTSRRTLDVNSLIADGFCFFEYVEKYRKLYDAYVVQKPVQELEKNLAWHSYGTLFKGVHALGFLFFCRFGDVYLSEALYAIAYIVSKLRNDQQIRRQKISAEDFQRVATLIHTATHEGDLLGKLMDPKNVYRVEKKGNTAERYWNSLVQLGKGLGAQALDGRKYIAQLLSDKNEDAVEH